MISKDVEFGVCDGGPSVQGEEGVAAGNQTWGNCRHAHQEHVRDSGATLWKASYDPIAQQEVDAKER